MCGVIGVAALNSIGIGFKEREVLRDMLVADSLRGSEGTGVMVMNEDQEVRVMKQAGDPFALFRHRDWKDFFDPAYHVNRKKDLMVVGHNRWASIGAINTKNAHPHQAGHITLVHNGTLQLHSRLPDIRKCDVDSEALARGIAELGVDKAIGGTYGAYAIIYFDSAEGTVNLLRNEERPLCFAVEEDPMRILFASEPGMLKWIASRRNCKIGPIQMLKPNMLMSFKVTSDPKEKSEPTYRRVDGPAVYNYHRDGEFGDMVASEFDDAVRRGMGRVQRNNVVQFEQSKKEKKATTRILKDLAKLGIEGQEVNYIGDRTVGDAVLFSVKTYTTHGKPDDERFMVTGKNPLYADTEFKFYAHGVDELEALIDKPAQSARIVKIVKFPKAIGEEPRYLVWVVKPQPRANQESQKSNPTVSELPNMSQVTKLGTDAGGNVVDLETGEVVVDSGIDAAGCTEKNPGSCALLEGPKRPTYNPPPPPPAESDALSRARNHQAAQGARDPSTWKHNPNLDNGPHQYKEDNAAASVGHDIYSNPEVVERILH